MISNLVAVLIMTNLVCHPCICRFCRVDHELGIAVCIPEHRNAVSYDCNWVVTTQYLPVAEGTQWAKPGEEE